MAYTEYRGCRGLVFAEVLTDDNETEGGYKTGAVKSIAGVAEISKTIETSSETHYYDNIPAIVVNATGADTVTFTTSVIPDEVLAEITGYAYDQTKKAIIYGERKPKYFAVGYILGETDETETYVWRYKGSFNVPDQTSATKDNGTTGNNMSLVFTGINTTHQFANGSGTGVKSTTAAMQVKAGGTITEADFFKQVYTPDTTAI